MAWPTRSHSHHPPTQNFCPRALLTEGYITQSDPEEDLEEDDDEDPEEDPAGYPDDRGDDGDDEDEPSDDGEDEEGLSAEETGHFKTDESGGHTTTTPLYTALQLGFSIPAPYYTSLVDAEVATLLAISTPPSSPLSLWSSPLPQIPSPPLPPILSPLPISPPLPEIPSPPLLVSSPVPVLSPPPPASPIRPLGYRAVMILLRAEAASTSHSQPLPPPIILSHTKSDAPSSRTPPLHLLSTDCRADRPKVTLPPRKRLGIAFDPRYEESVIRRDLERDVGYGITESWDEIVEAMQGTPVVTDVAKFSQRMTEFETRVRQDTNEIYTRLDDEQSERQLMACNLVRAEVMPLHTHVVAQQAVITELQAANHKRQAMITEMHFEISQRPDHRRRSKFHRGTEAAKIASDSNARVFEGTSRDPPKVLHSQMHQRRLVAVPRSNALTWWNSHIRTVGNDIAYAMTWTELKKKMTDKYCPRTEIKKLEVELWELKVKGTDVIGYNQRFQELALLCGRMFPEESDKIEKYVGGLPDMIHGSVVASKPKTMQEATEMAIEVMDKRIRTFADRQTENKRKQDNNQQP
ncbi:reverse transcriptase domain-containing protein [Tanacetum coccineum]